MKTIFLFGNRNCTAQMLDDIAGAAEGFIKEYGEDEICFVVGHRGGFDTLATCALLSLKGRYPKIRLWKLIAYYNPEKPRLLPSGFESTYYPEGLEKTPKSYAIVKANNLMLKESDAVICYAPLSGTNSGRLLRKARRMGIPVVELAES